MAANLSPQVNQEWEIRHAITVNGTITGVNANITVRDPFNNILIASRPMTKNTISQDFNYTIPASNISQIGIYEYTIYAYSTVDSKAVSYSFEVSPTGNLLTTEQIIGYFAALILALFGAGALFWGFLAIPWINEEGKNELIIKTGKKYLKILCLFGFYLVLLFIFALMKDISGAFLAIDTVNVLFVTGYYIFLFGSIPFTGAIILFVILSIISDNKIKRNLERGVIPTL